MTTWLSAGQSAFQTYSKSDTGTLPLSGGLIIPLVGRAHLDSTSIAIKLSGDFLVAQWLRVHLPMQGSLVPSLVREDSVYGPGQPSP